MPDARRADVAEIVKSAFERDLSERARYLDQACGPDTDLRAEVESLLNFGERAPRFMEEPAVHLVADLLAENENLQPDERLDQYEICSLIGSGGMGEVYLARDTELGRKVALKLVKSGLGTANIIRHFHQEERILAGLNHPHIARLYGGGVTPKGVPYFIMEYVEGGRLDEYCRSRGLTTHERLNLFRKVCSAVTYAHQHLVIHRDLKPANIRVTAEGEPKLLDFGIAKLLDPETQLGEQTITLATVMTPEYASPEQVRGESMTTSSDVYTLGVVLYELLTGSRPYRVTSRTPNDISHAITDQEPVRPSLVPPGDSEFRDRRSLRGDLDNIILMAMRKEPARRYSSVAQFSEDIRRHLEDLPLVARKDTWSYRSTKFIRRHKVSVAAAGIVTLTLLGGIAATMNQARRAGRQAARAERRFQDVRHLARSLMFDLHDAIENLPGSTRARELIVKEALKYLDTLTREAHGDPSLQRDLISAYIRVGNVQGNPSNANLGDIAGALRSYAQARVIAEQLLAAFPADKQARRSLGIIQEKVGDLQSLGGDIAGAVVSTRSSLATFRAIAEADPVNSEARLSLAISHIKMGDVLGGPNFANIGDTLGAMENYRSSLAILTSLDRSDPGNPKTCRFIGHIHERVGAILEEQGNIRGAQESYLESQRIREELALNHPENAAFAQDAAIAHEKMANVMRADGNLAAALISAEKSHEIFQHLFSADPKDVRNQLSLAISHIQVGDLLCGPDRANLGQCDKALQNYRQAVEILTPLAERDPPDMKARHKLEEVRDQLRKLDPPW